ncbi:MAG TPA: serine hydrolase [Roseiflexaceae bacterium]|nr:serine hydrolase [Roseiflexaceae bacterium]
MTTDAAGSFERVRELIRAQLVEQALPSLAVAVAREGTIVWEEGFGWADRERQIPATPQTLYSLALVREIHEESGYHARVGRLSECTRRHSKMIWC